jgi:cyclase
MRTSYIALVALFTLVGCDAAHAQDQGNPKPAFSVQRVAGNVYMLGGVDGGSNVTVLVGSDGLVLVDADTYYQKVVDALKQVSDKPARYVINTHCHGDHTWANAAFQREGATVIAHRNVRERLATESNCGPRPGTGLPTVTFDSELTLYVADDEIRIIKLPAGHTDGDATVYFKKANVVATGDAFVSDHMPGPSKAQDGNMTGIIDELRRIISLVPEDAVVIPGHGARSSIKEVRATLKTLEAMKAAIELPVRAGKTLDEIRAMHVLGPWKDAFGEPCIPHTPCDHLDSEFYLESFYLALTSAPPASRN